MNNKKIYIILFALVIAIITGCGVFVSLSLKDKNDKKIEIKEENKTNVKEELKKEEKEKDIPQINTDIKEEKEESEVIILDDYFLNYNLELTKEDCIELIQSTDYKPVSSHFTGEMYKIPISNEFKLYYTLNTYTHKVMENMEMDVYTKNLEVKISTIKKIAKNIFVEFEMPTNLIKEKNYIGIYGVICDTEKCNYSITTAGSPAPFTTGYMNKPEIDGNVIIVKPIYVTWDMPESQTDTNANELDITLYDTSTLKPIKTIKNYIVQDGASEEEYNANNYDALVSNYEKLETYKYTFTDNFKLVSVEKE